MLQLGVFGTSFPMSSTQRWVHLWKRTSWVTRVTLVLWIGNETLRSLPSSSRCRQGSFRQRNLRSGWRVRQYELTTWLRQRRRRAISQWIGMILYGFRHRSRSGNSRCVQRSVLFPIQRTRVTRVTRDVLSRHFVFFTSAVYKNICSVYCYRYIFGTHDINAVLHRTNSGAVLYKNKLRMQVSSWHTLQNVCI